MSHVSFGIPLMLGWSSKNSNQRCKMTGSLWEKTSFHNPIAMSIGKVLWPVSASKPNLYVQRYKSLKVCLFFTSFNKSGNLDWIPLIESDFRALHPLTNSSLLNLHIVSAWNFQASTKPWNRPELHPGHGKNFPHPLLIWHLPPHPYTVQTMLVS